MLAYSWLTSFGVAARSDEVKEQKLHDDGAVDVTFGLDNSKLNCAPFNSPGQLSNTSTVASEQDLELGPDWDDWCSESDQDLPDTQELKDSFPTLSAFAEKREAKKSIKGWSAVGHRVSLTLSSCEVDSEEEDQEDLLSPVTRAKASIEAWAEVGHKFASTLANCDVDSDEECHSSRRSREKIKDTIEGWRTVGKRLASALAQAAEEEDFSWIPRCTNDKQL